MRVWRSGALEEPRLVTSDETRLFLPPNLTCFKHERLASGIQHER